MAERIIMPKAGMAMERGVIVRWLKEVGDPVEYGEPLLEIETDKTEMQVESLASGVLLSKLYEAGDEVPVVTTIGWLGKPGEAVPEESDAPAAVAAPERPREADRPKPSAPQISEEGTGRIPASPKARRLAAERGISLSDLYCGRPIHAADVEEYKPSQVRATPLARRLAEQRGISLENLSGSGHRGKIFSRDFPEPAHRNMRTGRAALSGMRRTIARRMLESHQQIPPVTLNTVADVTFLAQMRTKLNDLDRPRITFNDLVTAAAARALREFPSVNVSYTDEGIEYHEEINVGIAVALNEGLIVPVVRRADELSLWELSTEAKRLAEAARDGKLSPDDYTGGTFTVSNLGSYGITSFTPIINLPEACILGVCAIQDRLALEDGQITVRKDMGLSLTFDHRCLDGASAAQFLGCIRKLLENPLPLLG